MKIKMCDYETDEIIFEGSENELLEINDNDIYLMARLNKLKKSNINSIVVVVGNFADYYKIYRVE